jgi:hypothetical protein
VSGPATAAWFSLDGINAYTSRPAEANRRAMRTAIRVSKELRFVTDRVQRTEISSVLCRRIIKSAQNCRRALYGPESLLRPRLRELANTPQSLNGGCDMKHLKTTSVATIILGSLFAEPLILVAFVVLATIRAPHFMTGLVWIGTGVVITSMAVGWVLSKKLVRWAWQE